MYRTRFGFRLYL